MQRIQELLEILKQEALTRNQLNERVSFTRDTVRHFVNHMHSTQPKLIHIARWLDMGGKGRQKYVAVFAAGDLPDAPKPANKPREELKKEYVERLIAKIGEKAFKAKKVVYNRNARTRKKQKKEAFAQAWTRALTNDSLTLINKDSSVKATYLLCGMNHDYSKKGLANARHKSTAEEKQVQHAYKRTDGNRQEG